MNKDFSQNVNNSFLRFFKKKKQEIKSSAIVNNAAWVKVTGFLLIYFYLTNYYITKNCTRLFCLDFLPERKERDVNDHHLVLHASSHIF